MASVLENGVNVTPISIEMRDIFQLNDSSQRR